MRPLAAGSMRCHAPTRSCMSDILASLKGFAQELKDAIRHQKLLQEAAASAVAQAHDARQQQQDVTEENTALKHEIQVRHRTLLHSSIMYQATRDPAAQETPYRLL